MNPNFLTCKVVIVLLLANVSCLCRKTTLTTFKDNIDGLQNIGLDGSSYNPKQGRKLEFETDGEFETEKIINLNLEYEMFGNYKDVSGYSEKYYSEILKLQAAPIFGKTWKSIGPTTSSNPETRDSGRLR